MTIKRRVTELEGKMKGKRTKEEREAARKLIEKYEHIAAERLKEIREERKT